MAVTEADKATHLDMEDYHGDAPGMYGTGLLIELAKRGFVVVPQKEWAAHLTRSVDVERWQRIETAALAFFKDRDGHTFDERYVALRDALVEGRTEDAPFEYRELTDSEQAAEDATWD